MKKLQRRKLKNHPTPANDYCLRSSREVNKVNYTFETFESGKHLNENWNWFYKKIIGFSDNYNLDLDLDWMLELDTVRNVCGLCYDADLPCDMLFCVSVIIRKVCGLCFNTDQRWVIVPRLDCT